MIAVVESIDAPVAPARAWWLVTVLLLAYAVSFVDRMVLSLLVDPIKADLGLSDTQISVLHGATFAIFYTAMGIPIAAYADRGNRRRLIAYGVTLWSLMTALCGMANSFASLALARVGVAVGEATLSPAAYSMLGDSFPSHRLSRAIAVYSLGIPLGTGLALLVGGAAIAAAQSNGDVVVPLLGTLRPWQLTFLVVALPGPIVLALLWTIKEPKRAVSTQAVRTSSEVGLWPMLRDQRSTYLPYFLGVSAVGIATNGFVAWAPSLFIRTHGWTSGETGTWLGLTLLIAGCIGTALGPRVAEILSAHSGLRSIPMTLAICTGLAVPAALALPLVSAPMALAACAVFICTSFVALGLGPAGLALMTPATMRARVGAIYLLMINLVGLGLGPTLVALSASHFPTGGAAIGDGLAMVCATASVVGACMFWLVRPHQSAPTKSG